jgi:hypothetical protein
VVGAAVLMAVTLGHTPDNPGCELA